MGVLCAAEGFFPPHREIVTSRGGIAITLRGRSFLINEFLKIGRRRERRLREEERRGGAARPSSVAGLDERAGLRKPKHKLRMRPNSRRDFQPGNFGNCGPPSSLPGTRDGDQEERTRGRGGGGDRDGRISSLPRKAAQDVALVVCSSGQPQGITATASCYVQWKATVAGGQKSRKRKGIQWREKREREEA